MLGNMAYLEEHFGILTDDGLALESTLVRPVRLDDKDVRSVQVWVPKYPLTRSSMLPVARREIVALGPGAATVNLTFDLRGSGESDGVPSREGFEVDLHAAHEWAKERFGPKVAFRPLGFPDLGEAENLLALPIRPGVLTELYSYAPDDPNDVSVLYYSTYARFERKDDALCRAMADRGYKVYGADMLRYLLAAAPLTLEDLWKDGTVLLSRLGRPLFMIARAYAAGPAFMMALGAPEVAGVMVTGPSQEGFTPLGLFSGENPNRLVLTRHARKFAPRPLLFLWNRAEAGKLDPESLRQVYAAAGKPRLWGVIPDLDSATLLNGLEWLRSNQ